MVIPEGGQGVPLHHAGFARLLPGNERRVPPRGHLFRHRLRVVRLTAERREI